MAPQYPYPAEKFDLVGRVNRSHGLKGEIKVVPLLGAKEDFGNYGRVALVAADGRMTALLDIDRSRVQGTQVILKLATIDNKSEADLTAGMGVLCSRLDHPPQREDGSAKELIGQQVVTVEGVSVGIVDKVSRTGAHPIMIVVNGNDEILIPIVDEMIVDRRESSIVVDPPPGLLDINRS